MDSSASSIFFIDHIPSNSRSVVEFGLISHKIGMGFLKKEVVLLGVSFVRGNVVDINVVRVCYKRAKLILLSQ
jgi:hypothetical protein